MDKFGEDIRMYREFEEFYQPNQEVIFWVFRRMGD